jgi:hypothetical protein
MTNVGSAAVFHPKFARPVSVSAGVAGNACGTADFRELYRRDG